jgi:hypothetical protein
MHWEERKYHWLSFAIAFDMMSWHLTRYDIHSVCFTIACEEALKRINIFTVCCFGTRCNVYKQTRKKCHLPPVINQMKFVDTLSERMSPTSYCSLSHVWQTAQRSCCLHSLSWSDSVVWGSVTVLLTPCPRETGLTSLLAMNDGLTHFLLVI